ncbi:hypothetical protein WJX77_010350 [Trebouxia sp. C0004]
MQQFLRFFLRQYRFGVQFDIRNGMAQPTTQLAEVEGKVVSAARLYRAVGLRGGFDNVSKRDWWRSIGQEFGTSAAADGVWQSKYELLLKGYEDKYLDASKYGSKADAVVSSVNRQYTSSSDSPAVSTAAQSQPSSSSSCLDGVGPFVQSGPTMENSATACPSQGRHSPARHQPVAQSTEAASSLSNGRPSGGADNAQPQHQHLTTLQRHPEQSDPPVGLQKQQGASKQLQPAEPQLLKAETQPAQRGSSPKANGSMGTHDKQEGRQSSQQTQPQSCAPPDAAASDMQCQQGPPTSAPSSSRITPPHLRQSTPEKQIATETTPAAATSSQPAHGPPLQHSFMSLQPQQPRPSTPVVPLRSTQPVWPVPAPRPASGIKRSASGEAASASAKKQKTTPLATYQQAQEHLRAQTARQGTQHGENRKVAEDLLNGIAPSLGPLLVVPSDFASSHAKEIQLALRSGVHSSVAWSLNALTVLSFNANPPLLLTQHPGLLDALLQVIASGVKEEGTSVGDCDECLTPAQQLLPAPQPQPKPGEPQGWWWEKEEGVLAPHPGAGWEFTHACCACNVLRNLAMESGNHAALVGQGSVAALVQCLEARREQPCPDTNDLALNALDCLHKVAPRLQLATLPSQLLWQLLSEVCHSMMAHDTPLRLRGTAAGVVQRLAQETQNLGSLAEAAEDGSLGMLDHLSALLRLDIVQAQQQVHQELAGSLGRPDMYANSLSQKDRSAMALNLQAQTLADAAKAVSELVRYQELRLKQAVASNRHLMVSLIQMLLSEHMQELDSWHKSTTRERLKDGLHAHILHHFENAVQYSTAVLINVSELPAAQEKLRVYEMRIAELAMTDSPQKEWVATLLSRIGSAPD